MSLLVEQKEAMSSEMVVVVVLKEMSVDLEGFLLKVEEVTPTEAVEENSSEDLKLVEMVGTEMVWTEVVAMKAEELHLVEMGKLVEVVEGIEPAPVVGENLRPEEG
jgi:F420-0:gamma-glutamyl ligase